MAALILSDDKVNKHYYSGFGVQNPEADSKLESLYVGLKQEGFISVNTDFSFESEVTGSLFNEEDWNKLLKCLSNS
jgi:hypothetical protein